jgi:hypothetical protein
MPKTAKQLKFKPWKPVDDTKPFLTNETLQQMIGAPSRTARVIMSRTKSQLIEAHRELGDAAVNDLDGVLVSSVERMQELIQMIEAARARLIISRRSTGCANVPC